MTGQVAARDPNARMYFGAERRAISLGQELGRGGEARVYEILDDPGLVAKIYDEDAETRRPKLEAMLKQAPVDPQRKRNIFSICWPEELLTDSAGTLAGFLMPRLDVKTFYPAALYWNAQDRAALAPGFTWRHLCVAAGNIASVVDLIHSKGHVIGDLNDENFLINDHGLASLVDCDSMQIACPAKGQVFRSAYGREPYTSPQLLGKLLKDVDRSFADDDWALAILVFSLLMEGHHPCNGVGTPEERGKRIKAGIFPFLGQAGFDLPRYALPVTNLPPSLQTLLYKCLREGHAEPSRRPSAATWRHELAALPARLLQCGDCVLHWYSSHLTACPWCTEKKRTGIDRFQGQTAPIAATAVAAPPVSTPPAPQPAVIVPSPSGSQSHIWLGLIAGVILLLAAWEVLSGQHERSPYSPPNSLKESSVSRPAALTHSAPSDPPSQSPSDVAPSNGNSPEAPSSPSGSDHQPGAVNNAKTDSPAEPAPVSNTAPAPAQTRLFQTSQFSISYPLGWQVMSSDSTSVWICQTNAIITETNGQPWCDYSVSARVVPAGNIYLQQLAVVVQIQQQYTNVSAGKIQPLNTQWGPGIYSTVEGDTLHQYREANGIYVVSRAGFGVVIIVSAPTDQWNAATTAVFNPILSSLQFK